MARHIALLRSINVGKRQVAMGELRQRMGEWGYEDVVTLLRSGNVVFSAKAGSAAKLAATLEGQLAEAFGFEIRVVLRAAADLAKIVKANPLAKVADDPARQVVLFLPGKYPADAVAGLDPGTFAPEAFHLAPREIHVWAPAGISDSPLLKELGKRLGATGTVRNWRTVEKLLALGRHEERSG